MAEGTSNYVNAVALDTATELPEPPLATQMDATGYLHDLLHKTVSQAIKALETKVGITGSADTASLDYKMGRITPNTLWAGNSLGSTQMTLNANEMRAFPFWLGGHMLATKIALYVWAQAGDISVALFNSTGTRLSTSGSIACPGGGRASVTVPSVALSPGKYFLGFSTSTGACSIVGSFGDIGPGTSAVAASHPCPASFTPQTTFAIGSPSLIVTP